MHYKLNFSLLSALLLQSHKISQREIQDVFYGDEEHTVWDSLPQYSKHGIYYYVIGFSPQSRFLQIVLSSDGDEVYFLDVKVAEDLRDIKTDFFRMR